MNDQLFGEALTHIICPIFNSNDFRAFVSFCKQKTETVFSVIINIT